MKQYKCSMSKKKESLAKKNEANSEEYITEWQADIIKGLEKIKDKYGLVIEYNGPFSDEWKEYPTYSVFVRKGGKKEDIGTVGTDYVHAFVDYTSPGMNVSSPHYAKDYSAEEAIQAILNSAKMCLGKKGKSKKSEGSSSVDDLLARHNQKWLVKVSYDVDASHSAVASSIVRADTKDAATNIALKRQRGLGYNMKVVSVEPMTESRKKSEGKQDVLDKLKGLDGVKDAGKVLADLKDMGFTGIDSGTYVFSGNSYIVMEHPDGMYAELDYTTEPGGDVPAEVRSYDYFKDIEDYKMYHGGHAPRESRKKPESKKSEGIGDFLDAKIDYNMFMRMCKTAAYLEEDEDYWDALWEYYSDLGSIGDALVFFDNLFQYTAWKDVEETYDVLNDKYKDESKSKEECIEKAIDDGALDGVYPYGDHYLWTY